MKTFASQVKHSRATPIGRASCTTQTNQKDLRIQTSKSYINRDKVRQSQQVCYKRSQHRKERKNILVYEVVAGFSAAALLDRVSSSCLANFLARRAKGLRSTSLPSAPLGNSEKALSKSPWMPPASAKVTAARAPRTVCCWKYSPREVPRKASTSPATVDGTAASGNMLR